MSSVEAYFEKLREWKKLPAYRLEPRVDAIVGFALPQILALVKSLEVATVIPELPLRIGSVQPEHEGEVFANRSYKADFFVATSCGKYFLIEFKTDSASRREKQDQYLEAAKKEGLQAVVQGVLQLYSATTYKKKYLFLIEELEAAKLVEKRGTAFVRSQVDAVLDILYVQPHAKAGDENLDVIGFEEVAKVLESAFDGDEFLCAAARAFRAWAAD